MTPTPQPSEANGFLADHAGLLIESYRRVTGRELLPGAPEDPVAAARQLWEAPIFVSSHDGAADPVLNYGNRTALALFGMAWEEFTSTPSRFTAEPQNRDERAAMLARAARDGFIDDYSGVRIARDDRRFHIEGATIWNVIDGDGTRAGQAATFARWQAVVSG